MLSETSKTILEVIEKQLESGDIKGLEEYGQSIDFASHSEYDWNIMALEETTDALKYQQKEIRYLRLRLMEFKKKQWFPIYEENLKLQKENKQKFDDLVKYEKTIEQLRKELMQIGKVADKYYQDAIRLNDENQKLFEDNINLKKVVASVQTFTEQYTK